MRAVAVIDDDGAEVAACLAELGAQVAVIRPDRYLLGVAHDAAELRALRRLVPEGA